MLEDIGLEVAVSKCKSTENSDIEFMGQKFT